MENNVRFYMKKGFMNNIKSSTISTGFSSMDNEEILNGGFYPALYVLGSMAGLGKTTLMLQIAENIARSDRDVIFFSLEMSRYEIMAKSISRYTAMIADREGIPFKYASNTRQILNPREYEKYSSTKKDLIRKAEEAYIRDLGDSLFIVEGTDSINADGIRATIQRLLPKLSAPPIVFVDYLQILAPPDDNQVYTDKQIVDANIYGLKTLSRKYDVPVFVTSSLNRVNYKKLISTRAFKESGAIEYTSDVLLGLEREVTLENETACEAAMRNEKSTGIRDLRLKVLKNRNGIQGKAALFKYHTAFNWFEDYGIEN